MDFDYSPKTKELQQRLLKFMDDHIYPNEQALHDELEANTAAGKRWTPLQVIEELKPKARAAGLWNLFLPKSTRAPEGLSNLEYAPLCEIMGRVSWAPEVFNCSAPDTGNMEVLARYANDEQKKRFLAAAAPQTHFGRPLPWSSRCAPSMRSSFNSPVSMTGSRHMTPCGAT